MQEHYNPDLSSAESQTQTNITNNFQGVLTAQQNELSGRQGLNLT